MNLQNLLQEQKKELREQYWKVIDEDPMLVNETLDTIITTAITKGYELALEEVEKLIKDEMKWEHDFQGKRSTALKNYNDGLKQVLTHLAHLKETNTK